MTEMVALPRFAAKAFTSSAAGCVRFEVCSRNTMLVDAPEGGAGIGVGAAGVTGGAPAAAGRGGGAAGKSGCGPASATLEVGDAAGSAGGVPPLAVAAAACVLWAGAAGTCVLPGGA